MGVSYSSENLNNLDEKAFKKWLDDREWLRFCAQHSKLLVATYLEFNNAPFMSKYEIECFLASALKPVQKKVPVSNTDAAPINTTPAAKEFTVDTRRTIMNAIWDIFHQRQSHVMIQEWLAVTVLLSPEAWAVRASQLFDVFKCSCSESIGYDEVSAAAEITLAGICRLWNAELWAYSDVTSQCNAIADHCYTKLGVDLEEDVNRTDFVLWITSRFKQAFTIVGIPTLKAAWESPYEQAATASASRMDDLESLGNVNMPTEDGDGLEAFAGLDDFNDLSFLNKTDDDAKEDVDEIK